jgi:hypothetical protein
MKKFLRSRSAASKGAALMIVLAFVVLLTGLSLAYFSRATTDRRLAQSSYNDTSADLLARSALDVIVGDFKQEILNNPTITRANIQPTPYPIPTPSDIPNLIRYSSRNAAASRASNVNSSTSSANGRWISTSRWNSHYLVPRGNPSDTSTNSSPVPSFTPPDWVLVTGQGTDPAPPPGAVIGRYAFAVYDEGGLLGMNLAGYPGWPNSMPCSVNPAPTPWLVNVGRKGTMAFADLTALGAYAPTQSQVDKIAGWRNYATTQRTFTNFPSGDPGFAADDCTKPNFYGSYLLYFGDPPFTIESLLDKLTDSLYPFTSASNYVNTSRTDQSLTTRQELLKLRSSIGFSQNVLQYMGTFSRERNRPAPDWPNLSGHLSDGRFNMNNLALVVPNPDDCTAPHGRKKGWQTGKNRNHLCGTPTEIIELFGLFWVKAENIPNNTNLRIPGHWRYIWHTGPNPPGDPNPNFNSIICWDQNANRYQAHQADFFQILNYALNVAVPGQTDHCGGTLNTQARTFGIGASLIDQYDSGADCVTYLPNSWAGTGCDLDSHVVNGNGGNLKYATHTTAIEYGQSGGSGSFGFGMEPDYSTTVGTDGNTNGDCPAGQGGGCSNAPHRPCVGDNQFPCAPNEPPAPTPAAATQVISHAFSNVGETGYGIDTSATGGSTPLPTLDFRPPDYHDAPVLDFFSYNPISSAYPRAGIVNLYTRNAPVLAAILAGTLKTDAAANVNPAPSPVISGTSEAMTAANRIVQETQNVLAGSPAYGPVTQTDLTRAIAARLAAAAALHPPGTNLTEQEQAISRALAEVGQTRTWNLLIDVVAQTGRYAPDATNVTQANKFIVEGEKRYWLHIALGRDLVNPDGTLCISGCQVDVLGTQLEEVTE